MSDVETSQQMHLNRKSDVTMDERKLKRMCSEGAELIEKAETVEDLRQADRFYKENIDASVKPVAELYSGLGDALLTRFYKYESDNWDLLCQAYDAYQNALALNPRYKPAKENLGLIKRYAQLTGDGRQFPVEIINYVVEKPEMDQLVGKIFWKGAGGIGKLRLPLFLHFLSNWRNLIPLLLVSAFFLIAIFAPWIAPPDDPSNPLPFKLVDSIEKAPLPPGTGVPLGTALFYPSWDMLLHYDVFHSIVWGTRDALRFGLIVAIFSAILGTLVGGISGYIGGIFNNLIMRLTDAFLAFPIIAGVWIIQQLVFSAERMGAYMSGWYPNIDAIVAPLTERQRMISAMGLSPVLIAFILFSWMAYARLINAGILRLKSKDYIMAARTIGATHWRVILRHLLPNAITPIVVLLARDIGALVVLRAAFSFIGMGGTILGGLPEWDRMLLLGRTWIIGIGGNILLYWWLYLPVTLILVLFGVSWNVMGDRLNIILNPREVN